MARMFRLVVTMFLLAGFVAGGIGCGKDEGKPNPDLKVPTVPPGNRGKDKPGGPVPR